MSGERSITVLHVSDMQFGRMHRFGAEGFTVGDRRFSTLAGRLLADIRDVKAKHEVSPDLLVASGDLAEWAKPAEFEQVRDFLGEVSEGLGLGRDRVVMVPGNHDVNRSKCQGYFISCEGEDTEPVEPYWPKWEPYAVMFAEFYSEVEGVRFPKDLPWTLQEIPELKTVVAALNSTMRESHRDEDHYGFCGEEQLRWFADRLASYRRDGWLRIGVLHHNPLIADRDDEAFLYDKDMFREVLAPSLNLLLHGHTHHGRIDSFGPDAIPVLCAGSTGVRADTRPDDVPNQYQLVRITADGLEIHGRRYIPRQYRWVGDTEVGMDGSESMRTIARPFLHVHGIWPPPEPHGSSPDKYRFDELTARINLPEPRRTDDLLARLQKVCEVQHPTAVVERIDPGPGRPQAYLRVTMPGTPQITQYPVGAYEGTITRQEVEAFITEVDARHRSDRAMNSILVYDGPKAAEELRIWAGNRGVRLRSLLEFQGLYDLDPYADRQAERLAKSDIYPPALYVPQRFSLITHRGQTETVEQDLLSRLSEWVADPEGRFVVVLGDFGHGKTFLLRELTRRIHQERMPPVVPIFIQLRDLEKRHTLEELLAAQLTAGGEEVIDHRRLRYLIHEGRVLLLFDGFDELALRVTYEQAAEHLGNLVKAAEGRAKIVITSRTQYFLSDRQVETALAKITELPGRRLVRLREFNDEQILEFLTRLMDGDAVAARARLRLLGKVRDLLGLSRNPRMLSFISRLPDDRLVRISNESGEISAAGLYRELLRQWLEFEYERAQPPGSPPALTTEERWAAVAQLALLLWESGEETLGLAELSTVSGALQNLTDRQLTADQAVHMLGSGTLLVRTEEERFRFVHRSVMEWLVADRIAEQLKHGEELPSALNLHPLSDLMAEFLCDLAGEQLVGWARTMLTGSWGEHE